MYAYADPIVPVNKPAIPRQMHNSRNELDNPDPRKPASAPAPANKKVARRPNLSDIIGTYSPDMNEAPE